MCETKGCFDKSCDYWVAQFNTTCAYLETAYGCECAACNCEDVVSTTKFVLCPNTCSGGLNCLDVAVETNATLPEIEAELGCDCTGCAVSSTSSTTTTTTVTDGPYTGLPTTSTLHCADSCFTHSCDFMLASYGMDCSELETDFSCDCAGCSCLPPTTTSTSTTTTTVLNPCGLRVASEYVVVVVVGGGGGVVHVLL